MKKIYFTVLGGLLLLPVLLSLNPIHKVRLRIKMKQGQTYTTHTATHSEMHILMGARDMTTTSDMDMRMGMKVKKVYPQDSLIVEERFKNLSVKNTAMGRHFTFDSDSTDNNMAAVFAKKPIRIALTPRGKVLSTDGVQAFFKSLGSANSTVKKIASKMASKSRLYSNLTHVGEYPEKPVGVGSLWQDTLSVANPRMPMQVIMTYTVKQIDAETVKIALEGEFHSTRDSMEVRGMKIPVNLTGKEAGALSIDRQSGMPAAAELKQNIKIKMNFMGQSMNMNMNLATKMTGEVKK